MKKKNFFSGFEITKEDRAKAGRFFAFFIFIYIALYSIVFLVPITIIESAVAGAELGILSVFGINGTVTVQETALITLENGIQIQISELCTGLIELLILVSAILASIGISWRSRIIGAIIGAIVAIAFNFARITATTLIIVSTQEIAIIDFAHNILFRVFLFITIAVAYIIWFQWAIMQEKKRK